MQVALTVAEKTRALTRAWNDKYVVVEITDDSLTYDREIDTYELPEEISSVIAIGQDPDDLGFRAGLSADAFVVEAGSVRIHKAYQDLLSDGKILYIFGWSKPTVDDSIDDVGVQEYVLKLAEKNCLSVLLNKRVFKFLKNDTTVGEIVAHRRELERDIADYRQQHRAMFVQM